MQNHQPAVSPWKPGTSPAEAHVDNHGEDQTPWSGSLGLRDSTQCWTLFVMLFAPPFSLKLLTLFGVSCLVHAVTVFSFKQKYLEKSWVFQCLFFSLISPKALAEGNAISVSISFHAQQLAQVHGLGAMLSFPVLRGEMWKGLERLFAVLMTVVLPWKSWRLQGSLCFVGQGANLLWLITTVWVREPCRTYPSVAIPRQGEKKRTGLL